MKRILTVCSIVLIAAFVLVACATPTATPAPTEAPATEAPTAAPVVTEAPAVAPVSGELVLWIMPNGADPQAAIDDELAVFMAKNPDIKVTTEVVGWGDAYSRIQTAQGGEGPV